MNSTYAAALVHRDLPTDRSVLELPDLLVGVEGSLNVFYAPFDSINANARIVLLGLTPGWTQMKIALESYRDARRRDLSDAQAQDAVKSDASFAGMRTRLVTWLDDIGVPDWLDIPSSELLFTERTLLHTTSLVRYPVFVGPDQSNYRGQSPRPAKSALLSGIIRDLLIPELATIPKALIVPMGSAVSTALMELRVTDPTRCLTGFPHPSGANVGAGRQFTANREQLRRTIASMQS